MTKPANIFTGLTGIEYPVTDVTTPESLYTYKIRTLLVEDEEVLKTSLISPELAATHIHKTLFKCIQECSNPDVIKDFETFEKNTTALDREALLFALYVSSYGNDYHISDHECTSCNKKFSTNILLTEYLKEEFYNGKPGEILTYRKSYELPISKIKITVKVPTISEEVKLSQSVKSEGNEGIYSQLLKIEYFEQLLTNEETSGKVKPVWMKFDKPHEKFTMYKQLPSRDRKFLTDKYDNDFANHKFVISGNIVCPHCKAKNEIIKDIFSEFFRVLY